MQKVLLSFIIWLSISGIWAEASKLDSLFTASQSGKIEDLYNYAYYMEFNETNPEYDVIVDIYQKGSAKEHVLSQYRLGRCYDEGNGVGENDSLAVYLYTQAANKDVAEAQNYLAYC